MKLTKKQIELVELIKQKQIELEETLYIRHVGHMGYKLIKLIENKRFEIINNININGRTANCLVDKEVLIPAKLDDMIIGCKLNSGYMF